jgi:hypothetical protein
MLASFFSLDHLNASLPAIIAATMAAQTHNGGLSTAYFGVKEIYAILFAFGFSFSFESTW